MLLSYFRFRQHLIFVTILVLWQLELCPNLRLNFSSPIVYLCIGFLMFFNLGNCTLQSSNINSYYKKNKIPKGCPEYISSMCQIIMLYILKYLSQIEFCHIFSLVTIILVSQFNLPSQFHFLHTLIFLHNQIFLFTI